MENKKKIITLYLDENLIQKMKQIKAKEGLSISWQIRKIMKDKKMNQEVFEDGKNNKRS